MIAFVAAAVVLTLACLGWIVRPLLRDGRRAAPSREASNLAILLDQLRELNADLATGELSPEQYAKARGELEQRALEEGSASSARTAAAEAPDTATAALLALALPFAAAALYLALGTPAALTSGTQAASPPAPHAVSGASLESMAAALALRLQSEPDDAAGWAMLARTYVALRRLPQALDAFGKAIALAPRDADALVDYADVLAAASGGRLAGQPLALIERALAIEPRQVKGLLLAGKAAFDAGDYARAIGYWERARGAVSPDSPLAQAIDGSLDRARRGAATPREDRR